MQPTLKDWKRPKFEPGEGAALIYYVVYGLFTNDINISRSTYRTAGTPAGVTLRKISRVQRPVLPFLDGDFVRFLDEKGEALSQQVRGAQECIVLQGEVRDPSDLNYLRDSIGVVTFFMDNGGVAVCDPQQLKFYDRADWRWEFFDPVDPKLQRHVAMVVSNEESGAGRWFHTRGMRKFGRPDISLRNVPTQYEQGTIELCNRFIDLHGLGGRIAEGQEIRMSGLPGGLVCRHRGSLDDPDFNNVHVEIQFPPPR